MGNDFEYWGHFYKLDGLKCRRYLEIKRVGVSLNQPDIMVIMMNPGSSCPCDGNDNNDAASETRPDPTQHQITRVMNITHFDFARVLNLSDVRKPNSQDFYGFIESSSASAIAHSVFDESRADELSNLFCHDVPVIYGWGVDFKLKTLAKMAMSRILANSPIGKNKASFDWAYYHPLPRTQTEKDDWVRVISEGLQDWKKHNNSK